MKTKFLITNVFFVFFLFGSAFAQDGELPGDANCDGLVDVLDVIIIVNYYIGLDPEPFCFENADVNGDGFINILDLVATVNIIMDDDTGTVTDIDGNVYPTVIIGDQEWMAGNLRVTRYNNGDAIPGGLNDFAWQNTTSGAYAIFPHVGIDGIYSDEEMVEAYGKLYNWHAVDDARGLCPVGWAVASHAEWITLTQYLGGYFVAGGKLKSTRTEPDPHPRWDLPNTGATNETGFSALPGSMRYFHGGFNYNQPLGFRGYYWTSTKIDHEFAWSRFIFSESANIYDYTGSRQGSGRSVRCFREVGN